MPNDPTQPSPVSTDTTPSGLRLSPRITLPESLAEFNFSSSSGPGGQNVNKRATKCALRVHISSIPLNPSAASRLATLASTYLTSDGFILITSDEHRSQGRNRDACIDKLSDLVKKAVVQPKVRRATRPSRGSIERRLKEKKHQSERKRNRNSDE